MNENTTLPPTSMSSLFLRRLLGSLSMLFLLISIIPLAAAAPGDDTDGDGMFDDDEIVYGFDATNPDEDGNGVDDGSDDTDGDGILNHAELYTTGTNPKAADTDGDGRDDGIEVAAGTDPLTIEYTDLAVSEIYLLDEGDGTYTPYAIVENYGALAVDDSVDGHYFTYLNGERVSTYNWSTLDSSFLGFLDAYGYSELGFGRVDMTLADGDVLEACIDPMNVVSESDEVNNCASYTFTTGGASTDLPDFRITSVTYDADLAAFNITVVNEGTAAMDPSYAPDINVNLDYNSPMDLPVDLTDGFDMNTYGTDYQALGGTMTFSTAAEMTIDPSTCVAYALFTVDGNGEVLEVSEDNDYRAEIDLCPETEAAEDETDLNLSIESLRFQEEYARVLFNVVKTGEEMVPDVEAVVRYQIVALNADGSEGATYVDIRRSMDIVALNSAGIDPMSLLLTRLDGMAAAYAAGLIPGEFRIYVTIDYWTLDEENGRILESNEEDNTASLDFSLSDWVNLVVEPGMPVSTEEGMLFNFDIRNEGALAIPQGIDGGGNGFYLDGEFLAIWSWEGSPDELTFLEEMGVGAQTYFMPWEVLTEGPHTFTMCADPGDVLAEKNEEDNCGDIAFIVEELEEVTTGGGGGGGGHGAGGTDDDDTDVDLSTDPDTDPDTDPNIDLSSDECVSTFVDLDENAEAICLLQSLDVVHGYNLEGELFGPENAILFYEFAKIWSRGMEWITSSAESTENEVYVEALMDAGVFTEEVDMEAEMTAEEVEAAFDNYGTDISEYALEGETVERGDFATMFVELFLQ